MSAAPSIIPGVFGAIALSALSAVFVLGVAFLVGRVRHRYRDIDVFWPLGFVVIALSGFFASQGRPGAYALQRGVLLAVVSLWGLRLAIHLAWRSRGEGEDPRYSALMADAAHPTLRAIIVIYGLQALLMFFISLPVTTGMFAARPSRIVLALGLAIWFVGFLFEWIGDAQLARFGKNPANQGKVLRTGLWAWTRHPNYFGDAVVWWGIFLIAASGGWALVTVLSPLVMTRLLTSVSGKPLLESRMKTTRPGYREYVATTSPFLPRRPKRPPV
jgi:steroid 5-alpha reductase family enzyme